MQQHRKLLVPKKKYLEYLYNLRYSPLMVRPGL